MSKFYPDVSHHHPVLDWYKVKANCPFLISKATEGRTYVDSTLDSFINGCENYKIPYWLYTYLRKGNEVEQVDFLIRTTVNRVGKYFVGYVLDVEDDNEAEAVKEALTYLSAYCDKMMLYTGYADYKRYQSVIASRPDNCAWWEARYGGNSGVYHATYAPHDDVDLHQYTSRGTCPGISGNCDLNRIVKGDESWYTTPGGDDTRVVSRVNVSVKILKKGCRGENVRALQILLNGHGFSCGNVDGSFGPKVDAAVRKFQSKTGLVVDGSVGPKTWAELLK